MKTKMKVSIAPLTLSKPAKVSGKTKSATGFKGKLSPRGTAKGKTTPKVRVHRSK